MDKRKTRKKEKKMAKKCPYCNGEMRCRGAADAAGARSWKCSNKRCGRTIWVRPFPKRPTPLVPVDRRQW